MLFYVKKSLALELVAACTLALLGFWGIESSSITIAWQPGLPVLLSGVCGFLVLTLWTLGVQYGYAVAKGADYARRLTESLATHYANANLVQIGVAFIAAAAEELFFRGFLQNKFGLAAASIAFMIAHIGGKDIRVIGYWSIFQGLGLGLLYRWSGNLLTPMIAHGLFDFGAMIYFRRLMAQPV